MTKPNQDNVSKNRFKIEFSLKKQLVWLAKELGEKSQALWNLSFLFQQASSPSLPLASGRCRSIL